MWPIQSWNYLGPSEFPSIVSYLNFHIWPDIVWLMDKLLDKHFWFPLALELKNAQQLSDNICDYRDISPGALVAYLMFLLIGLYYLWPFVCDYKSLCNSFHWEHAIQGDMSLCSQAMVMYIWLRISNFLISCKAESLFHSDNRDDALIEWMTVLLGT